MSQKKRYPVAKMTRQFCAMLKIDEDRLLRRVGLAPDFLDHEGKGVTAREFYALWQAGFDEVRREDLALSLGRQFAQAPYVPAILAFSCSPNIEIGLTRLALFKPLVAPVRLRVRRAGDTVALDIGSSDPDAPMPPGVSAFELVYFLECARRFTAEHIVPLAIHMPDGGGPRAGLEDFFGVSPQPGDTARMVLRAADAERPLISHNDDFWAMLEVDLRRQLPERDAPVSIADRVRATLVELLPSGVASADAVSALLNMSKRSLQRHLKAEGETFQTLLDATRSELSLRYLSQGDMSVEEISYLLAFRDPNSFYRAFQGWTGMTPMQARGRILQ
ncbi:AraC family transcriptional regulator [Thalassovita aquimarina]|uniref:AraC family transcriptional regulator ligand-binding domain-containing protein n=1 Tax=Thalassovita aquimarina TaxID=2785917 RepID=A0ABS5HP42_9RHOB|nr:AraC family transcriptional regulator [Thalassovita aquimarina]MBR9650647.1 AraC family transcriptional regulator ligand-binding domain-containing protein [Thalassovita aquimarina]